MKAALKQSALPGIWHWANDVRVDGAPSGVRGNLSGVSGNLSDVWGDLDACELTDADRKRGVHISELI